MASRPDDNTHQHEAEAAALLLALSAKRRYSLPSLIAQAHIRPRPFRRIQPTNAVKFDLASPYYDIIRGFQAETPGLMQAFATGSADMIGAAVARAGARIDPLVTSANARFPRIANTIERWHRGVWVQRVKASTGLDVSMLTQPGDVSAAVDNAVTWNRQLAADVAQQVKHRAATELVAGAAVDAPLREVEAKIADIVKKAKKRVAAIGDDQVDKMSRAMDRARRQAAGIDTFLWQHTRQPHPRDWHEARNGKTFREGDIPADDRAGVPPFCKCYEIMLLQ